MLKPPSCTHNTYPPQGWTPLGLAASREARFPILFTALSLTYSSPWCCVVGVQLLQVGGAAVCFDCLCTSGIPAAQLTLQDGNGIYLLINSPYFFVRKKRGSQSPCCQLRVTVQSTAVANVFHILPCVGNGSR